jgi:hypothetical protein
MERTQIFDLMSKLKLFGMRAAYDEVMSLAIKRQHEPPQIVGDLLAAEIAEKQSRSMMGDFARNQHLHGRSGRRRSDHAP